MKNRAVKGTGGEKTKGFFFSFTNQWNQLRPGFNWRTFTLLQIEVEEESFTGRVSASFALLGLVAEIQYVYDDTFNREMQEIMDGVESGEIETRPISELWKELDLEKRG
jgi:hypothetical protein